MNKEFIVGIFTIVLLLLTGCGYSVRDAQVIGQVKRVENNIPLLCDKYTDVDLSLGVMINGVGSMSSEDKWFYILNPLHEQLLIKAASSGKLVKITYDRKRWTWCVEPDWVTNVELVK